MNLLLEEIANAVDGVLNGPGSVTARGYSIDSRTLAAGDLFFAIRGPRFDGHQFIADALARKASGVVVEEEVSSDLLRRQTGIIRVKSTSQALRQLATFVRRGWGKPLIGVTGS